MKLVSKMTERTYIIKTHALLQRLKRFFRSWLKESILAYPRGKNLTISRVTSHYTTARSFCNEMSHNKYTLYQ